MTVLPAQLPSIANAQLPEKYEAAKTALAECARIDECKDWADKAHAMASYAKQADDDSLHKAGNSNPISSDPAVRPITERVYRPVRRVDGHQKTGGADPPFLSVPLPKRQA